MIRWLTSLLIIFAACLASAAEPRSYPCTIDRWIDADTPVIDVNLGIGVVLNDQSLRIEGIDCPERFTQAGKLATKFAVDWAAKHGPGFVYVESKKGARADARGRLLGSLKAVGGSDLAAELLKAGHAVPYVGGGK